MRIAIDALGIHYFGGGRTATLNLLEGLMNLEGRNQFLLFLTEREPSFDIREGYVTQVISPVKNRFLVRIWAQVAIPLLTREFDLVHFVKNLGVFAVRPPVLVTIYDMTTLIHPEIFPAFDVWYWRNIQPKTLTRAAKVIAISRNTAQDIHRYYNLPADNIEVIYPAIGPHFKPAPPDRITQIRKRYDLVQDYLIHVGRIDKKKNLTTLVKSFDKLCKQTGLPICLALAGVDYPKSPDIELRPTIRRLGLEERVKFLGRVPDEDLPALYSGAMVTVFPSIHEGFGLAPVEAMACGSPVLGHRAGAFQEASGEAAFVLDEIDVDSLADALQCLLEDPDLRQEYRKRGLVRAENFRQEKTAAQTLELYQRIVR